MNDAGVWAVVKESMRGGDRDFTSMGMRRAVVLLSIPMVLEMAMESLFALVDVFFVSRLGMAAVAVVGLTEGVMMLVYSVAWGLGAGITAVVARRTGEKDKEGADIAAVQGIYIAIALGLLFAVPGLFFAPQVLQAMGASPEVLAMGTPFMRIMLGSNMVILLVFGINAIFRGAGNAALAMRSLWIGNIINMVLDPLLIFGWWLFPEMGVTGAAVATVIGRGCASALPMLAPVRWPKPREDRRTALSPSPGGRCGTSSAFPQPPPAQFLIASASWVFLVRIVAGFGRRCRGRLYHRGAHHHLRACCPRGAWPTRHPPWWARTSVRKPPRPCRTQRLALRTLQHGLYVADGGLCSSRSHRGLSGCSPRGRRPCASVCRLCAW
jgi:Na+-driven multidrug efflux pump